MSSALRDLVSGGNNSDCGPINPLSNLLQQLTTKDLTRPGDNIDLNQPSRKV